MRKTAKFILAFCTCVCVALFAGCGEAVPDCTADAFAIQTVAITEETYAVAEQESVLAYSPLAKAEFLEPLEDFSWEREFAPEYVMIHFTSAVMLSRTDPYNSDAVRKIFTDGGVSIHYIIDRGGEVYCYIPETRAAWHAGKGEFAGEERLTNAMNKYSIGIELMAIGSKRDMAQYLTDAEYAALDAKQIGFTDAQYASLSALVQDVCTRNGIAFDRDHVIGHEEYNPKKSDPGELFDWNRFFEG